MVRGVFRLNRQGLGGDAVGGGDTMEGGGGSITRNAGAKKIARNPINPLSPKALEPKKPLKGS